MANNPEPNYNIENVELTVTNLIPEIAKATGLPENVVSKIILYLNFSLFKENGELTKFAQDFGIGVKNGDPYEAFYNWLKEVKQQYKKDHEVEAFINMIRPNALSAIPRASAWIYKTFVVREDQGEKEEKILRSRTLAESWYFRGLGLTLENLRRFKKVVKALDKYQKVVSEYVAGQAYTSENANEDR